MDEIPVYVSLEDSWKHFPIRLKKRMKNKENCYGRKNYDKRTKNF